MSDSENTIILLKIRHLLCYTVKNNVSRRDRKMKHFEKIFKGGPLAHYQKRLNDRY